MNTFLFAAIIGVWIAHLVVPKLLIHFWGHHFRINYDDIHGNNHTFHMFVKDPREASIVQSIFNKMKDP